MSHKIVTWVEDHSPVRGAPLALLLALARMINRESVDTCWCKNATLARKLRLSERSVQRHTAALEACGAIEKVAQTSPDGSGRQVNNQYRILTPGLSLSKPDLEQGRVTKLSPSHPDKTVTLPLTEASPSPRQDCHPPKEETVLQTRLQTDNETATTSARARDGAQARLPLIGEVPAPKSRPATFEDLALLREDIEVLVEITGYSPERCLERISDGSVTARNGAPRIPPAVRLEGMSADRVLRCRRDARILLEQLRRQGVTDAEIKAADALAIARRTA